MINDLLSIGAVAFLCCLPAMIVGFDDLVEFMHEVVQWMINSVCAMVAGLMWALGRISGSMARTLLRPGRRRVRTVGSSIRLLEIEADKWTTIRLSGGDPVWHEIHGWVDAADVCPCGYVTECAVWCGPGHENGRCPGSHGYRIAGGITAGEFAERIMKGMRDAGGAL